MPNTVNRTDKPDQPVGNATQVAGYIAAAADPANGASTTPLAAQALAPDFLKIVQPGVPVDGVSEVQTLTIGGTPTAGSFKLRRSGAVTASIPWSSVNATLLASIDAALEALPGMGAGSVATTAGTLTAGIGTVILTFAATGPQPLIAIDTNALTGTAPTLANALTTAGVVGTGGGQAGTGSQYIDTTAGKMYLNGGTKVKPAWKIITSA